uniref:Domain X domain-containing protein n=1 Tax=Treubia lacunosa TaxID=93845 RepID=A0A6C0SKB7_9MARC|nr:hypothetical protein [Treubia lacunosa]
MDNPLLFKSLIATSPRRIHKCKTVSKAPENCAKMPKSIQLPAFSGTGEPFGCLDFRMGQRAWSSLPGGGEGSAWNEHLRALWKHCQKEQFKAEGLFRLIKDINLWIATYKKLSPGSKNGGERPKGTSIKALETLRDSVINPLGGGSPTGRSWPKGHETIGRGGQALGPEGPKARRAALQEKCRRPEMAFQFPHTSRPRSLRTHKVSRALWAVGPSDASSALRGLTQKDKDILVQEVIRTILETVYEPYFLSCSHGFRPGRSQHTCLKQIRRDFVGTVWFIEGQTSQCFNKINKQVLIGLMRRRIQDNGFLNLVQKELETSLRAGAEGITKAKGAFGALLCNIVLHELDLFVMRLKRIVDRGRRGAVNPESKELWRQRQSAALIDRTTAHRARVTFPSGAFGLGLGHPQETRQINYVRFADYFIIGIIGPRALAERIRCLVTRFIEVRLKLNLHRTRKPLQSRPNTLHYVPMGPKAGNGFPISAHVVPGEKEKTIFCITKKKKIPFLGYLISRDSKHTYNLVRRGRRYRIRRSGGLSLLVDMQKVINRLAEKGFRDKSGHPKPNFAYFQYPQSYSVARIASILRGLTNYYHLANSKRPCVTRLSYILRTSLAKTYAAKFKLGTAAKVFAKGGRDLSKPIKAKKGRRPLLNRVLGSKTIAHRGAESEGHFPAIPYTRYGQIKLPDTKPLTKNWQPGQARLNCIAKRNLCQNCHREGNA